MKKLLKYPVLICFCAFIGIFSLLDFAKPDKAFSEFENINLAQKPKFTVKTLLENTYTMNYETYINQQFIMRDNWITMKSYAESALMKIENNGIAYGKDGYMFEKFQTVDNDQFERNIGFITEFISMYPNRKISLAIVPNAYTVLKDKVPRGLNNVDQIKAINDIYGKLSDEKNLSAVSFAPSLLAHENEYIYYRTDHHWTTLGAYYAYSNYVQGLGLTPVEPEVLKPLANDVPDFYGTYFSKAKPHDAVADTITYYDIPAEQVLINGEEADGYYDREKFAVRDKYAAFLRGNNGFTVLKSAVNQNKVSGQTTKVLVIKDSYANSFVPYLLYNFDEVHVMDLRDSRLQLSEVLEENGDYDDILLMYNYMNIVTDTNIFKLKY